MGKHPPRQRSATCQIDRSCPNQAFELRLIPISDPFAPLGHFLLELLLGLHQARVFRVFWNLVVLFPPAQNLDVVFVGQGIDVSAVVELGPASASEHLVSGTWVDQFHLVRRAFHQARQDDASGRQINSGGQRLCAYTNRQKLFLKQRLDDPAVFRKHARMVNADAALQNLFQFGTGTLRPIEFFQRDAQQLLLFGRDKFLPFEQLGHGPTLLAIEAEH